MPVLYLANRMPIMCLLSAMDTAATRAALPAPQHSQPGGGASFHSHRGCSVPGAALLTADKRRTGHTVPASLPAQAPLPRPTSEAPRAEPRSQGTGVPAGRLGGRGTVMPMGSWIEQVLCLTGGEDTLTPKGLYTRPSTDQGWSGPAQWGGGRCLAQTDTSLPMCWHCLTSNGPGCEGQLFEGVGVPGEGTAGSCQPYSRRSLGTECAGSLKPGFVQTPDQTNASASSPAAGRATAQSRGRTSRTE